MKMWLTDLSIKHPVLVMLLTAFLMIFLGSQFPKVKFDNDPENMLSEDEPVRLYHQEVKDKFRLYDFVIVGIVNEKHPDGIFNVDTLGRVYDLTHALLKLHIRHDGLPGVIIPGREDRPSIMKEIDLRPQGGWKRFLNVMFRHDPNRLFDEEDYSAIIDHEIISPSVVDNLKQAELGSLKMEYLMETPPTTRGEALRIRDDAMNNPLYRGTLVSEDGKAICLYIPIVEKTYSHNVASLIKKLTEDWEGDDQVFITGLPVAEDTFGVEMLVQMSTSAPMAGIVIFLLLLLFFRRISLIVAPMMVAVISVICTMGLLIGLGFKVHIMSSMIAIFLMPIAVSDSVHILSEFFDSYHRFKDKAKAIRSVVDHLFMAMLYTSLTTIAGFASLATTPIPPVKVFGLHVAFGVALAWLLTVTFIPAYIMLTVSEKSLGNVASKEGRKRFGAGALEALLERLGFLCYSHWRPVLLAACAVVAVAVYGISRIRVNDNPVKWFSPEHEIRVADKVLNDHFGGTYTAYFTLSAVRPYGFNCQVRADIMKAEAIRRFSLLSPEGLTRFIAVLDEAKRNYRNALGPGMQKCFEELVLKAREIDGEATRSWEDIAYGVSYLEADSLAFEQLKKIVEDLDEVSSSAKLTFMLRMEDYSDLSGVELLDAALAVCDEYTAVSFENFVFNMQAELTAPLFKRPVVLKYVKDLQDFLSTVPVVGKTSSLVDALQKASYELSYVAVSPGIPEDEAAMLEERNSANYSIPNTASAVGQVFTQLEQMKKKDSLFHMVTKNYEEANIWIQLKSGDNTDMSDVVDRVERYMADNPPPIPLKAGWAGLTYINVEWQKKMVNGMVWSLISSFIVVLVMMAVLFRSVIFGLLSMVPLSITILFIYGMIGLIGKDYDMPVAVLSSLTLGLSIDFAIHFLERAREIQKTKGSWREASKQMFKEPAMAISRNAITISIGFLPLLLAPLVPYRTVGFFLATLMVSSWVATLLILQSMVSALQKILFKNKEE